MNTLLERIEKNYVSLHKQKEECFWQQYMGLSSYVENSLEEANNAMENFCSDKTLLEDIQRELTQDLSDEDRLALEGWERFFAVRKAVDDPELLSGLSSLEKGFGVQRRNYSFKFTDPLSGKHEKSSFPGLFNIVRSNPDEEFRKSAWESFKNFERELVGENLLALVKKRNLLAHKQGYKNWYEYKIGINEAVDAKRVFSIVNELEDITREPYFSNLKEDPKPWNLFHMHSGEEGAKISPYLPFETALSVWGRSFRNLGVDYNGAELVLDLIARDGKYENGFMHNPVPTRLYQGKFRPGRLQFTANAVVHQPGGGQRALTTLFHEGGHAAHFANIEMPASSYAQEFAPTSYAFAEIQSMFFDNFLDSPSWLKSYGRDLDGNSIPDQLVVENYLAKHRSLSFGLRNLASVVEGEYLLYTSEGLKVEDIIGLFEENERKWLGVPGYRPTGVVPHLYARDSSAIYYGYLLAQIAVYETYAALEKKLGRVENNPQTAMLLKEHYWKSGNRIGIFEAVNLLSGKAYSLEGLQGIFNQDPVLYANAELSKTWDMDVEPDNLGASNITLIHGDKLISSLKTAGSFEKMAEEYKVWISTEKSGRQ
jgi:hypothetical protein